MYSVNGCIRQQKRRNFHNEKKVWQFNGKTFFQNHYIIVF
jgi:hypothetical protein